MPIVDKSTYTPPCLCSNAHIQTIVPSVFRKIRGVAYQRERIETPDGDFLDLDWSKVGAKRLAIVLHGLEGDSERAYMQGMVKALNRHDWDALAMNFRGCSGEPNRRAPMYHSGQTEDLDLVIHHVEDASLYKDLALVGFSLGGNVILKYLGEHSGQSHSFVKAAVVISVPCDLKACSLRLDELRNRPYLRRFLRLLRQKIQSKSRVMPGSVSDDGFEKIRTLKDFDDTYTAPIHGFKDANDYYEKASSRQFLSAISVPTLLINAADDPFLAGSCFPIEEAASSSFLFLEIPGHGGHVGFMDFNSDGEYWCEKRTAHFLETTVPLP